MRLLLVNVVTWIVFVHAWNENLPILGVAAIALNLFISWWHNEEANRQIDAAYAAGQAESETVYVEVGRVQVALEVIELIQRGMHFHIHEKERDPNDPRKLLVGKWVKDPLDPNYEIFEVRGIYNQRGFTETRKPVRERSRS